MNLHSDVKLYQSRGYTGAADRVRLSNGVVRAHSREDLKYSYVAEAYVPGLPWRMPSDTEYEALFDETGIAREGDSIALVEFPETITQMLGRSARDLAPSRMSKVQFSGILGEFCAAIGIHLSHAELSVLGVVHSDPEMLTTTQFSSQDSTLIGVHLDNWSNQPLGKTHITPQRLSINLGPEPRIFVYCNLGVLTMRQLISRYFGADATVCVEEPRLIAKKFLACFPDYPLVSVTLLAGHAYIAPTENILHDGCTIGKTGQDLAFHARGRFLESRIDPLPSRLI